MVRTKIIATLGPSASSEAVLRKMILAGLDTVRLNFSHGTHPEHLRRIRLIRRLNRKMRRAIKIMQDLEGYRIRVGRLEGKIPLKKNALLYLIQEDILGNSKEISFDYHGPLRVIKPGSLIYIDDGKILLKVLGREKRRLKTKVMTPGLLDERKGINILDLTLPFLILRSVHNPTCSEIRKQRELLSFQMGSRAFCSSLEKPLSLISDE